MQKKSRESDETVTELIGDTQKNQPPKKLRESLIWKLGEALVSGTVFVVLIATVANIGTVCSFSTVSWVFGPVCPYLEKRHPPAPTQAETPPPAPQPGVQATSVANNIYVTARDTPLLATPEPHGTYLGTIKSGHTVTATQDDQGDPDWLHVQGYDENNALLTGYVNRQDVAPQ